MWDFAKFSGNVALVDAQGAEYTYAWLHQQVGELAAHLPERALAFCLCDNSVGAVIGYATFFKHRIVPVMLAANMDEGLLDTLLTVYQPRLLWLPKTDRLATKGTIIHTTHGYALVRRQCDRVYPLHEDLALLITTSGSTGSPKLVRQSYANIMSNTQAITAFLGLDEHERAITTLPMNYSYGLSIINTHLHVGARLVATPYTVLQREFWSLFTRQGITSFSGVPYTYEMLDKLRFFERKLPTLCTITQSGARLLPALHKKIAAYAQKEGKRFFAMYGASEATTRMAYLPADKALEKCGSIGVAIPGGKFSLINERGDAVTQADTVGELLYEGPNVTLGYATCGEDLAKGDERGGRLLTGDMAMRDTEGYYTIVGRKSRFLKLYGNRVGLDETERLIKSAFTGFECACSGEDDAMHIFITDEAHLADVKAFLAKRTRINATAFHVKYLPALPRNEAGKLIYAQLQQYYD